MESKARPLFSCTSCGLPFLADELLPHSEHVCPDCSLGRVPADLPDEAVTAATEREVRLALEGGWKFVTSRSSSLYLHRVARQMASRIKGAPLDCRVVLFEGQALQTLALPSGLILVSLGTLAGLEDEAQLAFVLGHELAHAASGDAAVRLVRLGFKALVRDRSAKGSDGWAGAALDLVKLGYGRRRERDADARSVNAMLALGYDPNAAIRYLQNIDGLIESGAPGTEELSLAHPSPGYRVRKLEKMLFGRVDSSAGRQVNREVFKRALERPSEESDMVRLETLFEPSENEGMGLRWLPWAGLVAALIITLLLVFGLVL
jgi:predicted Zn-dependent protease